MRHDHGALMQLLIIMSSDVIPEYKYDVILLWDD